MTTDIKEVIARLKPFLEVSATYDSVKVTPADFRTLMHAAEAGIAARDAALEEAAAVCIKYSKAFDRTIAKADAATTCATRIRALRSEP